MLCHALLWGLPYFSLQSGSWRARRESRSGVQRPSRVAALAERMAKDFTINFLDCAALVISACAHFETMNGSVSGAALALPWRCPELLDCEKYENRTRIFEAYCGSASGWPRCPETNESRGWFELYRWRWHKDLHVVHSLDAFNCDSGISILISIFDQR